MFSINLTNRIVPPDCTRPGYDYVSGEIIIGDFKEHLDIPVSYWSLEDYRAQWRDAVSRLVDGGSRSALLTQCFNPADDYGYCIESWSLYRYGDTVYVHNQYLKGQFLSSPWTLDATVDEIGERKVDDHGKPLASEWRITMDELVRFAEGLEPPTGRGDAHES